MLRLSKLRSNFEDMSSIAPDLFLVTEPTMDALGHAQNRQLTAEETATAVAELKHAATGWAALLAECTGLVLGYGENQFGSTRCWQIAELCIAAGVDETLIEASIEVGRQRATTAAALTHNACVRGCLSADILARRRNRPSERWCSIHGRAAGPRIRAADRNSRRPGPQLSPQVFNDHGISYFRAVACGPGADASHERDTTVRAQADHLRVPHVSGGPAVPVPVRRVRIGAVSGRARRVCRGDAVGSARAGAVHQEHSLGVASQDHGQGVLDNGGVVPGPAAGDEEAEGLFEFSN
jgi:hypothetical protein